jgi:hypothetical protein
VTNLTLFKTSNFTVDRAGRESWFDVVTGPVRYRASTSWAPAAAIGVTALIVSVQLVLPLALSGGPQSGSTGLGLSLLEQLVTGCLVWFAAGLGNGTSRAVLSLPPLKGASLHVCDACCARLLSHGSGQIPVAEFAVFSR